MALNEMEEENFLKLAYRHNTNCYFIFIILHHLINFPMDIKITTTKKPEKFHI